MAVSFYVVAGNSTRVLCKDNMCYELLYFVSSSNVTEKN